MFENHPKSRIWVFQFWHFPSIFVLLKVTCLVTLFDQKLHGFKNSPIWPILAFLMNLCPLKMKMELASLAMLNKTFSVIFKHHGVVRCPVLKFRLWTIMNCSMAFLCIKEICLNKDCNECSKSLELQNCCKIPRQLMSEMSRPQKRIIQALHSHWHKEIVLTANC